MRFFVAWVPGGFRLTCYYYRKAWWRSFLLSPPACAVAGPRGRRYTGESRFPFVLNNLHRFFLYLTLVVVGFLWYDAIRSFFFRNANGSLHFGIGLGSLIMLVNVILLSGFTFGCNSMRHLVGEARLLHVFALRSGAPPCVARGHRAQPVPHAVGVGQPGRRCNH